MGSNPSSSDDPKQPPPLDPFIIPTRTPINPRARVDSSPPPVQGGGLSSGFDLDDFRVHDEAAAERPAEPPPPVGDRRSGQVFSSHYERPSTYPADEHSRHEGDDRQSMDRPTARPSRTRPGFSLDSLVATLRSSQKAQLIVLTLLLALLAPLAIINLRNQTDFVSFSKLKENSASYDGQVVKVRGRVGEVFQMGASYTFNLHQGKDTLVIFTRSRAPIPHQKVTITGSISTGYLEGKPRLALFETSTKP